jgi:hypothetical protein
MKNDQTLFFSASHLRTYFSLMLILALIVNFPAHAGPGAHGPDGEHLDAPAGQITANTRPRVEANSELFELVAELHEGELSILIDHYATNEPVLDGKLQVESGALKATAKFHADHGDYAIDDPDFLKQLAIAGEHALVFTVQAGNQSDLLDGVLRVSAAAAHDDADHDHDHAHEYALWIGAGVAALALLAGAWWWRKRRRAPWQTIGDQ